MILASHSKAWKWGLSAILCLSAIVGIFSFYDRSSEYSGIATERVAGPSAPLGAMAPAGIAIEPQAILEQGSSGPMIIRTVSLRITSTHPVDTRSSIDEVVRRSQGYIDT